MALLLQDAVEPAVAPARAQIFSDTVEGFLQYVREAGLSERFKRRLLETGLDVDKPLQRAYPREKWEKFLRISVDEFFPGSHPDDAYRRVGEGIFKGFCMTLMGRALARSLKELGPHGALATLQKLFRSSNNYMIARTKKLDEKSYEVWLSECNGNPGYNRGLLLAGLGLTGAQGLRIVVIDCDGRACTYRVSWT